MKPQECYVKYLLSHSEQRSHWMDYLTLRTNESLNIVAELWVRLDTNNSNIWYIESEWGYDYSLEKSSKWWVDYYHIWVTADIWGICIPVPLLRISYNRMEEKRKWLSQYLHNINIYGSAFRLIAIGQYQSILQLLYDIFPDDFNSLLEYSEITRLDYCLDLFYSQDSTFTPSRHRLLKGKWTQVTEYSQYTEDGTVRTNTTHLLQDIKTIEDYLQTDNINWIVLTQTYSDNECLTWWRAGNIKYSKSNLIRCYEKTIDTVAKGKMLLYSDYLQYKVRRVETQFWYNFCISPDGWYYKFSQLEELINKAMSFMCLSKKQKYYYEKHTIPQKYLNRVIKWYKTSTARIARNGLNPFVLAEEGLYENNFQIKNIIQMKKEKYIRSESEISINGIVDECE